MIGSTLQSNVSLYITRSCIDRDSFSHESPQFECRWPFFARQHRRQSAQKDMAKKKYQRIEALASCSLTACLTSAHVLTSLHEKLMFDNKSC